jgi:hypothetical protein
MELVLFQVRLTDENGDYWIGVTFRSPDGPLGTEAHQKWADDLMGWIKRLQQLSEVQS